MGEAVKMTKVQVELTQYELWLCIQALEFWADDCSDAQRMILDPSERRDIETEEVECRELQERLEVLRKSRWWRCRHDEPEASAAHRGEGHTAGSRGLRRTCSLPESALWAEYEATCARVGEAACPF